MLDAVAELARDILQDIDQVLRHEIDADTLRADEAHDLLDLFGERRRRIEQTTITRFVEEDELRLVGVADLRQGDLEQTPQAQPEEEGRIATSRRSPSACRPRGYSHNRAAILVERGSCLFFRMSRRRPRQRKFAPRPAPSVFVRRWI